jgi:hypothetical protein
MILQWHATDRSWVPEPPVHVYLIGRCYSSYHPRERHTGLQSTKDLDRAALMICVSFYRMGLTMFDQKRVVLSAMGSIRTYCLA